METTLRLPRIPTPENPYTAEEVSYMKRSLICYKGGCYEGCFWEWNFAWVDAEGVYHSIFHSGSYGSETAENFAGYMNRNHRADEVDVYNADELQEFADSHNAGNVRGVAEWLWEKEKIDIRATCSKCGSVCSVSNRMELGGYEDAGGCRIVATEFICEDCREPDSEDKEE